MKCENVKHFHSQLSSCCVHKTQFSMRRGERERKIIIAMMIIVVMMRTMIIAMQKVFGG